MDVACVAFGRVSRGVKIYIILFPFRGWWLGRGGSLTRVTIVKSVVTFVRAVYRYYYNRSILYNVHRRECFIL